MYFKINILVIAILGVSALVVSAHAAEPLANIDEVNKALTDAKAGDTVIIKDGIYRDAFITMPASGEEGKPVTLTAQTPGGVIFTGNAPHPSTATIMLTGKYQHVTGLVFHKSTGGPAVWFKGATFSRLSHCAFNESGETRSVFSHMIEMGEDAADNEIDHCYMSRSISMSIGTRGGALRCKIHHNWWRDITALSSNGQEPLQLQYGRAGQQPDLTETPVASLFALVEYNLFDGACGDEEIVSVKSNDNTIRYNTFLAHPTANKGGLNVRHAHRTVVDSNVFLGTDYGVRVSGDDNVIINNYIERPTNGIRLTAGGPNRWAYLPARNTLVANNTVIDSAYSAMEIATYMGMKDPKGGPNVVSIYPTGNRILNNLLVSKRPDSVVRLPPPETGDVKSNEYRNNLGWCAKAKSVGDIKVPDGVEIADPKLAKAGDHFRPEPGSPALGKGILVKQAKADITGHARSETPDIGCEQVTGGSLTSLRVMSPKEVGPEWMKGDHATLDKEFGLMAIRELVNKYPDDVEYRKRLRDAVDAK